MDRLRAAAERVAEAHRVRESLADDAPIAQWATAWRVAQQASIDTAPALAAAVLALLTLYEVEVAEGRGPVAMMLSGDLTRAAALLPDDDATT